MDDCLQITHHRAFDDPRRGAQRDVEILGRVPFKVSDKQLHRRYVQSSRGQTIHPISIQKSSSIVRESWIGFLRHSADVPLTRMWNQCRSKEAIFDTTTII